VGCWGDAPTDNSLGSNDTETMHLTKPTQAIVFGICMFICVVATAFSLVLLSSMDMPATDGTEISFSQPSLEPRG